MLGDLTHPHEVERARKLLAGLYKAGESSRIRADLGADYEPYTLAARGLIDGVRRDPRFALDVVRAISETLKRVKDLEVGRTVADYESKLAALRADSLELDMMRRAKG
jgi:hypothetical protein